ncbi:MAG: hypothetical protein HXY45_07865 [Syntrophaceae bacterium]|nr:hypothetical protein [Syntrophaceae bacterium]
MKKIPIAGLRQALRFSQIEVLALAGGTPALARVLGPLAESGINLEFISFHGEPMVPPNLILGVHRNQVAATLGLLKGKKEEGRFLEIRCREPAGMISLFPHRNRPEVVGNFLAAFRQAEVEIWSLGFSLSALSALGEESRIPRALNALSDFFELAG